eukprot:g22413.t1
MAPAATLDDRELRLQKLLSSAGYCGVRELRSKLEAKASPGRQPRQFSSRPPRPESARKPQTLEAPPMPKDEAREEVDCSPTPVVDAGALQAPLHSPGLLDDEPPEAPMEGRLGVDCRQSLQAFWMMSRRKHLWKGGWELRSCFELINALRDEATERMEEPTPPALPRSPMIKGSVLTAFYDSEEEEVPEAPVEGKSQEDGHGRKACVCLKRISFVGGFLALALHVFLAAALGVAISQFFSIQALCFSTAAVFFFLALAYASELFTAQATDDVIAERSAEAKEALQGETEAAWSDAFLRVFVAVAMITLHSSAPWLPVCLGSLVAFFLLTFSAVAAASLVQHAKLSERFVLAISAHAFAGLLSCSFSSFGDTWGGPAMPKAPEEIVMEIPEKATSPHLPQPEKPHPEEPSRDLLPEPPYMPPEVFEEFSSTCSSVGLRLTC